MRQKEKWLAVASGKGRYETGCFRLAWRVPRRGIVRCTLRPCFGSLFRESVSGACFAWLFRGALSGCGFDTLFLVPASAATYSAVSAVTTSISAVFTERHSQLREGPHARQTRRSWCEERGRAPRMLQVILLLCEKGHQNISHT